MPFFKDRGLKDTAISDTLSLMTFKELKQDEFVIEYGSFGEEFYVILEGECEILVPDTSSEDFKKVDFELKQLLDRIEKSVDEYELFQGYLEQLQTKKKIEEKAAYKATFAFERSHTT